MNLVLCERYSTKMTAGACEKFRANTPERCKGCDGPAVDVDLDGPVELATPVHVKPKGAPLVVDCAKRNAEQRAKKEVKEMGSKDARKTIKKVAACGKCSDVKPIMARGLCGMCWHRERNAGTLDENFPSAHKKDSKPSLEAKLEEPKTKDRACARCNTKRSVGSRGLCVSCYYDEAQAGTLDEKYPSPHGKITSEVINQSVRGVSILEPIRGVTGFDDGVLPAGRIQITGPLPGALEDCARGVFEKLQEDFAMESEQITSVTIPFSIDDQDLLDFLTTEAKRNRRNLDQEILFRLERSLPADDSGSIN